MRRNEVTTRDDEDRIDDRKYEAGRLMRMSSAKPRGGLIAALDVGSSKVCCFIARADEKAGIRVMGIGHQMARGLRGGTIVDMDAAESAIRHAVHAAEQMAGETIKDVIVNVSCGSPASRTFGFEVSLNGHEISDGDVQRVLGNGLSRQEVAERELLHAIPVGFAIDGCRGIRDPRGMYGERLGADMHIITAGSAALRNLGTCIRRCHLDVEAYVLSAYASGLATLVEDEMDLGVAIVDMGGGTTTIAVFYNGESVFTDSIPIGGTHVTQDIARGLATPIAHAERIKTLYGGALPAASDDQEIIDIPQIGEEEHAQPNHVPKSYLVGIIQPRVEETLELVRSRLEASAFDRLVGRCLVLTGGASQLQGVSELATLVLDKQVRMGRPMRVMGIAEATGGPAFSTCAGLLIYALQKEPDLLLGAMESEKAPGSVFGRFGVWLRDNF